MLGDNHCYLIDSLLKSIAAVIFALIVLAALLLALVFGNFWGILIFVVPTVLPIFAVCSVCGILCALLYLGIWRNAAGKRKILKKGFVAGFIAGGVALSVLIVCIAIYLMRSYREIGVRTVDGQEVFVVESDAVNKNVPSYYYQYKYFNALYYGELIGYSSRI